MEKSQSIKQVIYLLLIFCVNSIVAQPDMGFPHEPGKCYAKSLIPDVVAFSHSEEYYVYQGDSLDADFLKYIELTIVPGFSKWEKKMEDGCLKPDPKDCLKWSLTAIPEEIIAFYEVVDTSKTSDFKKEVYEINTLVQSGGTTEWREVVCDGRVSRKLLKQLRKSFIAKGYDLSDENSGQFEKELKATLVKFQKSNSLPIGNLNLETLALLGIEY